MHLTWNHSFTFNHQTQAITAFTPQLQSSTTQWLVLIASDCRGRLLMNKSLAQHQPKIKCTLTMHSDTFYFHRSNKHLIVKSEFHVYHENVIAHLCQQPQLQLMNAKKCRFVDYILVPTH